MRRLFHVFVSLFAYMLLALWMLEDWWEKECGKDG